MKDGRHEQFADWITRYYSNHKYIPDGHSDGELIGKLIRCKDCLYWRNYCRVVDGVTSHHVCGRKRELDGTMHRSKANDFCSWAERKEE